MRLLSLFLISILVISCQSAPIKQFADIKPGMEKMEVLEVMGTPWTSTRLHGKDRWIYIVYENNQKLEKEVHFLNGSVVYAGDAWKPAPEKTAVAKDQQNEELEKKLAEENSKQRQQVKEAYGEFEKEAKGEGKKVKYMPNYEEVR